MVDALVVLQELHLTKGHAASSMLAGVGTLLDMELAVRGQRVLASKALATGLTGKWTLSRVAADVGHDLVALGKWTAFAGALGPATGVGALATCDMILHDMSNKSVQGRVDGAHAAHPLAAVEGARVGGRWRGGSTKGVVRDGVLHLV